MHSSSLTSRARPLGFGFLHAFFSAPGQTFLISGFVASFAAAFSLGPDQLGTIYLVATIGSAMCLMLVGPWIDRIDLRLYSLLAALALAAACLVTATATNVAMLALGILLLRLSGQGLMIHIEATATARTFLTSRGKALSVTGLGLPAGEALLPPLVALLIAWYGWRTSYGLIAAAVVLFLVPAALALAPRTPPSRVERPDRTGSRPIRALLRSPYFWMALPILLVPPTFGTAALFHIQEIAVRHGWSAGTAAMLFPALAAGDLLGILVAGPLVDRFSARRMLFAYPLPMIGGFFLMAVAPDIATLGVLLATVGITGGLGKVTVTALWAEVYGTEHLGAVRSVATMLLVLGTAAGPAFLGLMMAGGFTPSAQLATLGGLGLLAYLPLLVSETGRRNSPVRLG